MTLESILSQDMIQRLGWTLLHFVWQATAIAFLLAILLVALRKASSNVRDAVACVALGLIVLLPLVTMSLVPTSAPQPAIHIEPPPESTIASVQTTTIETPVARVIEFEESMQAESIEAAPKVSWKQRATEKLEASHPYLVIGWLIGVFGLSLWHLGGWAQLQRLKRHMVKPVDDTLQTKLDALTERLRISRAVRLVESALVQVPTVVGWLRPVILLPASALTGLTPEQLEALLTHELAHIRRCDYLINILQTIVETLGFYHPAVWWISHKIRVERENCCDDLAVGICGDRVRYARALASMEEIRSGRNELAVAATGGNLFGRIRRLVGKESSEKNFSWIPAATVVLLLVTLAISTTLALTKNEMFPTAELDTNTSETEPSTIEKNDSSTKILIEAQTLHVTNEFLEQVGLDADSLKHPNSWGPHRVDNSNNLSSFVIDSQTKQKLLKNVAESEGSSSISRLFMMGMSGREAMIKNNNGYDFKSQKLGRVINIRPELSQDGQGTYVNCELMMRQFKNLNLFLDVYINKKIDQNDVSESEVVEHQRNTGQALLSDDHTLLILGGKLVSFRDVENGTPILRHIPFIGQFFNTVSKIKVEKNEIILIKTTIAPAERNDDIDSKASSFNVATIGSKTNELIRIYFDLDLEPGQYVEIKDSNAREPKLKQVDTSQIGKSARDFPAYAGTIDFEIRSNIDLKLSTQRFTRGSFFEHNNWDAYFAGPDTIMGNGRFSPTTLCIHAWKAKLYLGIRGDATKPNLVAIKIKPKNKQQKSSTEDEKEIEPITDTEADVFNPSAGAPVGKHALLFDGVDDCLHVPASPTLALKPPFTIEMWVKPDLSEVKRLKASGEKLAGLTLMRKGKILHDKEKTQAGGFAMVIHPSSKPENSCSGSLYLGTKNGILIQEDLFVGKRSESGQPEWIHVSMSSKRSEMYMPVPDEPLVIGEAIKSPVLQPFKGQIAEVRIWNKLFTRSDPNPYAQTALTGSEPNLIACWDFERTKGQIVYDISPNGNHAYLGTSPKIDNADPRRLKHAKTGGDSNDATPGNEMVRPSEVEFGSVGRARYTSFDSETKRLEFEFGFEKLLHKTEDIWEIEKPYMNAYHRNSTYHITADKGEVKIKTVAGSTTPQDVTFNSNVVIHIVDDSVGSIQESFLYLDNLTLRDDRSRFTSTGPVRLVSKGEQKVGTGLDLIYNDQTGRFDYFKIANLESLQATAVSTDTTPTDRDYTNQKTISGIVRDEKGRPIEGVKLNLIPPSPQNFISDDEGEYVIHYNSQQWGSPEIPRYIQARHERLNLAAMTEIDHDVRTLDITLEPGAVLSGRIVNPEGKGIAGANTTALLICQKQKVAGIEIRPQATSDSEGNFEIKAIPAEYKYWVTARADGYHEVSSFPIQTDGTATDMRFDVGITTLPDGTFYVTGIVVDASDQPVANATVSIDGEGQKHQQKRTDAQGKFTFVKLVAGRIQINAQTNGAIPLNGRVNTYAGASDVKIVVTESKTIKTLQKAEGKEPGFDKKSETSKLAGGQVRIVKVDLSVVEVFSDSKMDRETKIAIENLLGGKITLPDSPAVPDLIRKSAEATATVQDESAGDKRVTPDQFTTLVDLLAARAAVKILMNPTLQVVDGQTAKIGSSQHIGGIHIQKTLNDSIEITPHVPEDDTIILQVEATLHQRSPGQSNGQTPTIHKFESSSQISFNPGQSRIIGGTRQVVPTKSDKAEKNLEKPDTEILIILTPTIIETAKQPDRKSPEKTEPNQVVLKLVDPNSRPVAGARVGTYVDWSDIAENPPIWFLRDGRTYRTVDIESDEHGKVVLDAEDLFRPERRAERKVSLIAIDAGHYLAGLRELSREDLGTEVTLTLQPGCRVRGRVSAATARKRKWSTKTLTVYVDWGEHRPCRYTSKQGRFEIVLPPGTYQLKVYAEDPDNAVNLPIRIQPGHRDLDLTPYLEGTRKLPDFDSNLKDDAPAAKEYEVIQLSYVNAEETVEHINAIASPGNMSRIAEQIAERDDFRVFKPRLVKLQHSDPVQMARLLTQLFAEENRDGVNIRDIILGEDAEKKYNMTRPLCDHFTFEGVPGTHRIIVVSNIPQAYDAVEQWILELDKQKMATKDVKEVREWMAGLGGGARPSMSRAAEERKQSSHRMKLLGLGLALFTREHGDTLCDTFLDVKPYVRDELDFTWMLDNVEYLGKGKTAGQENAAHIPIAYDRTMLDGGAETNVLFLDFSVRWLDRKKLNELGIHPQAIKRAPSSSNNTTKDQGISKVYDVSDVLEGCLKPSHIVSYITEHVEPESWYAHNKTANGMIMYNPGGQEANKITIVQTPEIHSKIERLLEEVRRSPDKLTTTKTQILITMRILTAGDAFMKHIGLDPNSAADSKGWSDYRIHRSGDSTSFIIDPLHADLLIKTAMTHKDAAMFAGPQLCAADGRQATIQIYDTHAHSLIPSDIEPNTPSGKTGSKPESIKLGTFIKLEPDALPDGKTVDLEFEWEYRKLLGFKKRTGPDQKTQKVPRIAVDKIATSCPIPDGKTLLITGKKITEPKKIWGKIQLADLPLIGGLFHSPTRTVETRNLLILIKPTINPPRKAQGPPTFTAAPPFDSNDPLIKKLEAKLKHSDE